MPISLPFVTAFTKTDFTAMFGCIGVVMVCPLSGTMTPGTFSQMGLAPSMGTGPLIAFTWMATGWLTARGTCPRVRTTPTMKALSSTPHTTALFLVCMIFIVITPPSVILTQYINRRTPTNETRRTIRSVHCLTHDRRGRPTPHLPRFLHPPSANGPPPPPTKHPTHSLGPARRLPTQPPPAGVTGR